MDEFLSDPAIIGEFITESREHLEGLESKILQLEQNPEDSELLNAIFRAFHTIKGSSSFLGLVQITKLSHKLENILDKLRKGELKASSDIVDSLLKGVDVLRSLVEDIASGQEERIKKVSADFLEGVEDVIKKIEIITQKTQKETEEEKEALLEEGEEGKKKQEEKRIFLTAAKQHTSTIKESLEGLRENPSDSACIDSLFRAVHSLKSSSSYMGFLQIKSLLEKKEEVLQKLRDKKKKATSSELLNSLEKDYEKLVRLIEEIEKKESLKGEIREPAEDEKSAPRKESKKPSKGGAKGEIVEKSIRVPESKLDTLMNLVSELIINRSAFFSLSQKLDAQCNLPQISKEFNETIKTMARISADLQVTVTDLHMLPIKTLFGRFPRLVRDLSKEKDKKIKLETSGEETKLDKMMIERMADPLVHLIRNAIDHGIEKPEERERKGKPKYGVIKLSAFQEGQTIIIQIEDDGRGLDAERIKEKAIEKGIIDGEKARSLNREQSLELIFIPGFSTASKVTDISGRGVGMDVVKNAVEELKGEIKIHTEPEKGTRFTIRLPVTMAIVDVLLIEASGQIFALPISSIIEIRRISQDDITKIFDRKKITILRGNVLGVATLKELLGLNEHSTSHNHAFVISIEGNGKTLGLIVDALHHREEIVIKPLEGVAARTPGLAGATILGDGQVIPILDPGELIQIATEK